MSESMDTDGPAKSCPEQDEEEKEEKEEKTGAPVILVVGMAGSGKTTFVAALANKLIGSGRRPYVINLDPAVGHVPYAVNVDIRDSVNYKSVMGRYSLGPNGAIVTSLNLFATQFDQVVELARRRRHQVDYFLVDTPGQIEVFNWSASGSIIAGALAAELATVLVYVVDAQRSQTPTTFMSNMLYASSMLYKYQLPFVMVVNKSDVVRPDFINEWMTDFSRFDEALSSDRTYMGNLTRSLSLVLDKFYENLRTVPVSSYTGQGLDEFFELVNKFSLREYEEFYVPAVRRLKRREQNRRVRQQKCKLQQDLAGSTRSNLDGKVAVEPLAETDSFQRAPMYLEPSLRGLDEEHDEDDDGDEESEPEGAERLDDEEREERLQFDSFRSFIDQQMGTATGTVAAAGGAAGGAAGTQGGPESASASSGATRRDDRP